MFANASAGGGAGTTRSKTATPPLNNSPEIRGRRGDFALSCGAKLKNMDDQRILAGREARAAESFAENYCRPLERRHAELLREVETRAGEGCKVDV